MKEFFEEKKYKQFVEWDGKNSYSISKWGCTCADFTFRQVQKEPIGKCKHIAYIIESKLKERIKRPTEAQKLVLRQLVNMTCQNCHQGEEKVGKLSPHRIRRGYHYYPNNILMICLKCHRYIHSGEFK